MNIRLGSCPDSWGVWFADDPRQIPWPRFLDEVAEAGYQWIELGPFGYLPTEVPTLRRELDARGLHLAAGIVMRHLENPEALPAIRRETEQLGEILVELGGQYLVLIDDLYQDPRTGAALGPARLDGDAWKRLVETSNELGRLARERFGLQVVFHPHAATHVETGDQIEDFLAQTDPGAVDLCLDFGHCEYRHVDSLAVLRKHHDRIPYLHLKAVDPEVRKRVEEENVPFGTAVAWGVFTELGKGIPRLEDLLDVLHEVGYEGWGIVEQDLYPVDFDKPLPIARRTRARLREAGLG